MEALADKVKETLNLSGTSISLPSSFEKYSATHSPTTNAATWKDALAKASGSTPADFVLTKTLLFKPKVAKSEKTVLAMVVALNETATTAGQVAKTVGSSDARVATKDAVKEALEVTVEQGTRLSLSAELIIVSPLSISKNNAGNVHVLLDTRLVEFTNLLAFHPSDASKTVFITSAELTEYLISTGVQITEVDFSATSLGRYHTTSHLSNCSSAPGKAEAKRATTKTPKEDAKIDGAALIGIDVKKDLDFPNWYQQVLTKGEMVQFSPKTR
jgi:prolyl-tRNA synthetase